MQFIAEMPERDLLYWKYIFARFGTNEASQAVESALFKFEFDRRLMV